MMLTGSCPSLQHPVSLSGLQAVWCYALRGNSFSCGPDLLPGIRELHMVLQSRQLGTSAPCSPARRVAAACRR